MKQGSVHYKPEELHKLITEYDDIISPVDTILQAEWDKWKCDSEVEIGKTMGELDVDVIYKQLVETMQTLSASTYSEDTPNSYSFLWFKWKSTPPLIETKGLGGYALIGGVLSTVNKELPKNAKVCLGGSQYLDGGEVSYKVGKLSYPSSWMRADNVYLCITSTTPEPTKSQSYYQEATTTLSSLKQLTALPNSEFVVLNDEQVGGLNEAVRVYKEIIG